MRGVVEGDEHPAAVGHPDQPGVSEPLALCRKAKGSAPVIWRRNSAITAEWVKATATLPRRPPRRRPASIAAPHALAEDGGRLGAGDQVPALFAQDPGQLGVAAGAARRDPVALPLAQVDLDQVLERRPARARARRRSAPRSRRCAAAAS